MRCESLAIRPGGTRMAESEMRKAKRHCEAAPELLHVSKARRRPDPRCELMVLYRCAWRGLIDVWRGVSYITPSA